MPKALHKKRNGAVHSSPYSPTTKPQPTHNIFKMNTDLGQHVLKNPGVAQAIVDKADLKQSDIVLEVGPGTGNLTVKILEKAKKVLAVELDPRMAAEVTKRVQGTPEQKRLDVMLGDVIKMDLPYFDVCISNTPYQISSPLTFKLLSLSPGPRLCILTFQLEFAQRLFARPGDRLYSRLSVNAQMWAHITHVMKIGKNNFRPPPAVESSVVKIVPKVPRPGVKYEEWDGLLRVCFVRKNRTLRAGFLGTTSVLDMVEGNWRTWCAQNDIGVDEGEGELVLDDGEAAEEEWDGIMDLDNDEDADADADAGIPDFFKEEADSKPKVHERKSKRRKRGKVAELVREKVRKVLEDETGLADKRARMCDEADFLRLLWAFNQEGIHFS